MEYSISIKDKVLNKMHKLNTKHEYDWSEKDFADFLACYDALAVSIQDLPIMKQILITIHGMCIGSRAVSTQMDKLNKNLIESNRKFVNGFSELLKEM